MSPARRNTWQREAVREALADRGGFVSAQDLHQGILEGGQRIGLATVYRALGELADDGRADAIVGADSQTLYRECTTPTHHHHLICRICGRTVEIAAPEVERWVAGVAAEHGFVDPSHTLDIFAVCASCHAKGLDAPAEDATPSAADAAPHAADATPNAA